MVVIERARSDDFEPIAALARSQHREFIARALGRAQVSVARVDGAVRGFVIADAHFFGHLFVDLLEVHPDFRRRGIASALMRAAELDAPTDKLFTSTNQSNLPMQRLCARLGFVPSGRVDNLDEGDPELFYFKRLAPERPHSADDGLDGDTEPE